MDKAMGDELRAVTWIYVSDGKPEVGNLLDGCPCLGFRYRQKCKHYTAAADAYAAKQFSQGQSGVIGELVDDAE